MFISLYTTRLILNGLGATDFGIYNIVGGAIAMLGFLNGAMAGATQRFMSYAEGEGNKEKQRFIFNISIILHTIIAFVVGIMLVCAGFFFFRFLLKIPDERIFAAQIVYFCLIVSTIFTIMTVPYEAILNAHENMRYYSIIGIFESFLKLLVAIACTKTNNDKLVLYGILMSVIPLCSLSIMRVYCHKKYNECVISPKLYFSKPLMKEMTSFAGWNFLGSGSSLVGNYGIGIVLNHFFGALLNAALGIANQLNGFLLVFSNNMLKAVNPIITKSEGSGCREQMIIQSTTACKYSFLMLALFALPIIFETPYILSIWLVNTPEWAVIFTQLQLVRALIEQLTITYGVSINSEGNISSYNKICSVINLVPIIIISILFKLGAQPVSMYWVNILVWGIIYGWIRVFFMNKNCKMKYRYFFSDLLFPSIIPFMATMGLLMITTCLFHPSTFRFFLSITLSLISYLSIFIKYSMSNAEYNMLICFINRWKK